MLENQRDWMRIKLFCPFRADEMAGILVHVLGAALRARRERGHGGVLELLVF